MNNLQGVVKWRIFRRNKIFNRDLLSMRGFVGRFHRCAKPILVTKNWEDFGAHADTYWIPLPMFLLMF